MSKPTRGIGLGLLALAVALAVDFLTASAQEPNRAEQKPGDDAAAVLGTWERIDRHVALASLLQPEHGVRKRKATVHFARAGGRDGGQGRGVEMSRTLFRGVRTLKSRLHLAGAIEVHTTKGPKKGRCDRE